MPSMYPDYVFAGEPLVPVYETASGRKKVANLFLGEWMKRLPAPKGQASRTRQRVRYRGGEGWVEKAKTRRERMLEMYFLSVGQGDPIPIQILDDRRIPIDGGLGAEARAFIRNKYALDKPDNYIDFDAVIATHSDADHAGGLVHVLEDEKIAVRRFLRNGLFPGAFRKSGKQVAGLLDDPTDAQVMPRPIGSMNRLARGARDGEGEPVDSEGFEEEKRKSFKSKSRRLS